MDQKIIELSDAYNHGLMDRRDFIKKLALIAGGTAAAQALLPLLENNYALAEIIAKNDARLETSTITYRGATGDVRASFARPKGGARLPGVIVVHENRGLNPHIEDVTRRVALEGYLAMAPDALSPLGGTPSDEDQARDMIGKLDAQDTVANFVAAVAYLKNHGQSTGKVGIVGFCWGGAMANQVAVHSPDVLAAVPYYGRQPASGDVPKIKASLLLHYASLDDRINKGIPDYETALKKASIEYTLHMYEGANHAFNNDTNAARYHKEAAQLAWKRTIDFLNAKLKK